MDSDTIAVLIYLSEDRRISLLSEYHYTVTL